MISCLTKKIEPLALSCVELSSRGSNLLNRVVIRRCYGWLVPALGASCWWESHSVASTVLAISTRSKGETRAPTKARVATIEGSTFISPVKIHLTKRTTCPRVVSSFLSTFFPLFFFHPAFCNLPRSRLSRKPLPLLGIEFRGTSKHALLCLTSSTPARTRFCFELSLCLARPILPVPTCSRQTHFIPLQFTSSSKVSSLSTALPRHLVTNIALTAKSLTFTAPLN